MYITTIIMAGILGIMDMVMATDMATVITMGITEILIDILTLMEEEVL